MLIRPPSSQKSYDNYHLLDPAFIPPPPVPKEPPDDASAAELEAYKEAAEACLKATKAHFDRMRAARESGRWADVTVEGKTPTKFVMHPIPGTLARRLQDKLDAGLIGDMELRALAFRAAIGSVENWGSSDYKITPAAHEWLGTIASEDVVNDFDLRGFDVVNDLGGDAFERARSPSPK